MNPREHQLYIQVNRNYFVNSICYRHSRRSYRIMLIRTPKAYPSCVEIFFCTMGRTATGTGRCNPISRNIITMSLLRAAPSRIAVQCPNASQIHRDGSGRHLFDDRRALSRCRRLAGSAALAHAGLLSGLCAAACKRRNERSSGAPRDARAISSIDFAVRTDQAENSTILPSLPNAITSKASTLPSGISIPGEPRGMPGTAIPRMPCGLSISSFATWRIGTCPSIA